MDATQSKQGCMQLWIALLSIVVGIYCLSVITTYPGFTAAQEVPLRELQQGVTIPESPPIAKYASILKEYVTENGLVDYLRLQNHRHQLDEYVQSLNAIRPNIIASWSESEQIAFWLNAYNAFTLTAIIDHYPIQSSSSASGEFPANSIRQIPGVWTTLKFKVEGQELTLDEIEHQILRKKFNEPRIHMALVCASVGCPPLRNEPYRGVVLDGQLTDQTKLFLSTSRNLKINHTQNRVAISPIFEWFKTDFVEKYGRGPIAGYDQAQSAILHFIADHVTQTQRQYLLNGTYSLHYLEYDWTLNEYITQR
jgi:hypothetical protein